VDVHFEGLGEEEDQGLTQNRADRHVLARWLDCWIVGLMDSRDALRLGYSWLFSGRLELALIALIFADSLAFSQISNQPRRHRGTEAQG
jgi:hypothetical protein